LTPTCARARLCLPGGVCRLEPEQANEVLEKPPPRAPAEILLRVRRDRTGGIRAGIAWRVMSARISMRALCHAPSPTSTHSAPRVRSASQLPSRASAVRAAESSSSVGVLGDGWSASQVDAFADSPETRALVTCDLVELRPTELCPELPMYLLRDGDDIVELWARTETFARERVDAGGVRRGVSTSRGASSSGSKPMEGKPETFKDSSGLHPPYWAVPWVGGQGVARYVLDNPEIVRGKTVLDVGSGCGVAALAAAMAGAELVCANDIDPLAAVVFLRNAEMCGLVPSLGRESDAVATETIDSSNPVRRCVLETSVEDLLKRSATDVARFDVIMAGDVCFVKGLAESFQSWLAAVSQRKPGAVTILGDPGRREQWAPKPGWAAGMRCAATYEVRTAVTSALTEGQEVRSTVVWLSEASDAR